MKYFILVKRNDGPSEIIQGLTKDEAEALAARLRPPSSYDGFTIINRGDILSAEVIAVGTAEGCS